MGAGGAKKAVADELPKEAVEQLCLSNFSWNPGLPNALEIIWGSEHALFLNRWLLEDLGDLVGLFAWGTWRKTKPFCSYLELPT